MRNSNFSQPIPLPKTHAEWLQARRLGIGGSDVAAILGISPWVTPRQVWEDKLGISEDKPVNESMYWGTLLEAPIRKAFMEKTGIVVRKPSRMFVSKQHPFMLANLDGLTPQGDIVEIKTARMLGDWGESGSDEIPRYYLTQVQHYMAVMGAKQAHIAVLIGASDFRTYTVKANQKLQEYIIEQERQFWDMVQNRIDPPVISVADANATWRNVTEDQSQEATPAEYDVCQALVAAQNQIKELEAQVEAHKLTLMQAMRDKTALTYNGKKLVSWTKPVTRKSIDSKKLAAEFPEAYEECLRQTVGSRMFRVNFKGE